MIVIQLQKKPFSQEYVLPIYNTIIGVNSLIKHFNLLITFMKKIILSVAIIATCLTACKKKSDDPAPTTPVATTKTTSEYLTAHSWKTSGSTADKPVNYDGDPNTPASADVWAQYKSCSKDDIVTFNADGTGSSSDAGVQCSTNATIISNFTWTLTPDNKNLILSISANSQTYTYTNTLNYIDDNNLSFSSSNTDEDDLDYIQTVSFVK